jgi:hypothetical protein
VLDRDQDHGIPAKPNGSGPHDRSPDDHCDGEALQTAAVSRIKWSRCVPHQPEADTERLIMSYSG